MFSVFVSGGVSTMRHTRPQWPVTRGISEQQLRKDVSRFYFHLKHVVNV